MVLEARLKSLPDIEGLRKLTRHWRCWMPLCLPNGSTDYSFNSKWGEGEMMASMRNGSGDEYFILFDSHGVIMPGSYTAVSILERPQSHPTWAVVDS
jgi:hypothetical protein